MISPPFAAIDSGYFYIFSQIHCFRRHDSNEYSFFQLHPALQLVVYKKKVFFHLMK